MQNATAIFTARPDAQYLMISMGRPMRARFGSRCELTGTEILRADHVRRVEVQSRRGGTCTAFVANRTLHRLHFVDQPATTTWSLTWSGWAEEVSQQLAAAAPWSMLQLQDPDFYATTCAPSRGWQLDAYTGKWHSTHQVTSVTTKQLAAQLRRNSRSWAYRVVTPR